MGISFELLSVFSGEGPKIAEDGETIHRLVGEWNEYKTKIQGSLFFLPFKVLDSFNRSDESINNMLELLLEGKRDSLPAAYKEARDATSGLGLELKRVLGIDTSTS